VLAREIGHELEPRDEHVRAARTAFPASMRHADTQHDIGTVRQFHADIVNAARAQHEWKGDRQTPKADVHDARRQVGMVPNGDAWRSTSFRNGQNCLLQSWAYGFVGAAYIEQSACHGMRSTTTAHGKVDGG
jgi:hypothetical protein